MIAVLLRARGHGGLEALRERLDDQDWDDGQYAVRMLKRTALTEESARACQGPSTRRLASPDAGRDPGGRSLRTPWSRRASLPLGR